MNASAEQAREDHRRHDGRFGEQHRAEADGFVPPLQATADAEGWVMDFTTPHPSGGYVTVRQVVENHVEFYDAQSRKHRLDGPAVIEANDHGYSETYMRHGRIHRDDGPAVTQWAHLPGSDRVEVTSAWWNDGTLERIVRDYYTDDLLPGPHEVDGLAVVVHPRHAAPHDPGSQGPVVLPWEDAEEVAQYRAARARMAAAQSIAARHPALSDAADATRDKHRHFMAAGHADYTQAEQEAWFRRRFAYVTACNEKLLEEASQLSHEGRNRAEAAQERFDKNNGWLRWLPSRKAAREAAATEREAAHQQIQAAAAVQAALRNKEDK